MVIKKYFAYLLGWVFLLSGCGGSGGGSEDVSAIKIKQGIALPDVIKQDSEAIGIVEIGYETNRDQFTIATKSDSQRLMIDKDKIKLEGEGVRIAWDLVNDSSCVNKERQYVERNGSCNLPIQINSQKLGVHSINLQVTTRDGKTAEQSFKIEVVEPFSPKLGSSAMIVNYLDPVLNGIYGHSDRSVLLYNAGNKLNNVRVLDKKTKLVLHRAVELKAGELSKLRFDGQLELPFGLSPSLDIMAANLRENFKVNYLPHDWLATRVNHLEITKPGQSKLAFEVLQPGFEVVKISFDFEGEGVALADKPFNEGDPLESTLYNFTFSVADDAYGAGDLTVTLRRDGHDVEYKSKVTVQPISLKVEAADEVLREAGQLYTIKVTNQSAFNWSISQDKFELGGLAPHAMWDNTVLDNCRDLSYLAAGGSCNLQLKYTPDVNNLRTGNYALKIKDDIRLPKTQSVDIKVIQGNQKLHVYAPVKLSENDYKLEIFNNDSKNVDVTLIGNNLDFITAQNCGLIKQDDSVKVTVSQTSLCTVELRKSDVNTEATLEYDSENGRGKYYFLQSEQLLYIYGKAVVVYDVNKYGEFIRIDENQYPVKIQKVQDIVAKEDELYIATDVPGVLYRYKDNTITEFIHIPDNSFIQHIEKGAADDVLVAVSFNPFEEQNNFWQINLQTRNVELIASFSGYINRIKGIEANEFHIVGTDLIYNNQTSNILVLKVDKDSSKSGVMIPPLPVIMQSGPIFDVAHTKDTYYAASIFGEHSGLIELPYPLDANNTVKAQTVVMDDTFYKEGGYVSQVDASIEGDAVYAYGWLKDNQYVLMQKKQGQVKPIPLSSYIRYIVPMSDGLYYSATESSGNNHFISRWKNKEEEQKIMSQNFTISTTENVLKLKRHHQEVVSSNAFSVLLPASLEITERKEHLLQAKEFVSRNMDSHAIDYVWSGEVGVFNPDATNQASINLTAPAFNPRENNQYNVKLLATLDNEQQALETIVEVLVDPNLKGSVAISGDTEVTENNEVTLSASYSAPSDSPARLPKADGYSWTVPAGWSVVGASNQATLTVKAPNWSATLTAGSFSVTATDDANITTDSSVAHGVTVKHDTNLKGSVAISGAAEVIENNTVTLTANVTNLPAGREIQVDGYDWNLPSTWSVVGDKNKKDITIKAPRMTLDQNISNINVVVDATDNAGVRTSLAVKRMTIKPDHNLLTVDAGFGDNAIEGSTKNLAATVSGSGTAPYSYLWTNNQGITITNANRAFFAMFTVPILTAPNEDYTFTVTVTDAVGRQKSANVTYIVTPDNNRLQVSAGTNGFVQEEMEQALSASASNGTAPYQYKWTTTDGVSITNQNAQNATFKAPTYNATGNNRYTFNVEVTDGVGRKRTAVVTYDVEKVTINITKVVALPSVMMKGVSYPFTYEFKNTSKVAIKGVHVEYDGSSGAVTNTVSHGCRGEMAIGGYCEVTGVFTPRNLRTAMTRFRLGYNQGMGRKFVSSLDLSAVYGLTTPVAPVSGSVTSSSQQWPARRFEEATNSIGQACNDAVYDKLTGLMWRKDGRNGSTSWNATWPTGTSEGSTCGYTDWRQPNLNELRSLVNYGHPGTPASWLNANGFNNIQSEYWTTTEYGPDNTKVWWIDMTNGQLSVAAKSNRSYVMAVREERPPVTVTTVTPIPEQTVVGESYPFRYVVTNSGVSFAVGAPVSALSITGQHTDNGTVQLNSGNGTCEDNMVLNFNQSCEVSGVFTPSTPGVQNVGFLVKYNLGLGGRYKKTTSTVTTAKSKTSPIAPQPDAATFPNHQWPEGRIKYLGFCTMMGSGGIPVYRWYDNLTGLTWHVSFRSIMWQESNNISSISTENNCGAMTGLRLPTVNELQSLGNFGYAGTPFVWLTDVGGSGLVGTYWTSSPVALSNTYVWAVDMTNGKVVEKLKTDSAYVILVKA